MTACHGGSAAGGFSATRARAAGEPAPAGRLEGCGRKPAREGPRRQPGWRVRLPVKKGGGGGREGSDRPGPGSPAALWRGGGGRAVRSPSRCR